MSGFEVISREFRVDPPNRLWSERLKANPVVSLPAEEEFGHKYLFDASLISVFEQYAEEFRDLTINTRAYRNAKLLPAYMPTEVRPNRLPFIAAWGKATEWPYPRQEMADTYFSGIRRGMAYRGKRSLQRATLDAEGFVGYFYNANNAVNARVFYAVNNGVARFHDFSGITEEAVLTMLFETIAEQRTEQPLRFKVGVKYNPWNQYIGNEFYPESQHDIRQLAEDRY